MTNEPKAQLNDNQCRASLVKIRHHLMAGATIRARDPNHVLEPVEDGSIYGGLDIRYQMGSDEPKALMVPPMPEWGKDGGGRWSEDCEALADWGHQCAEIARAQERRADEAENELHCIEDEMTGKPVAAWPSKFIRLTLLRAKMEATLAQRDREVLALRKLVGESLRTFDMWADVAPAISLRSGLQAILASTAQAADEAERRIRADEREHLKAIITDPNNQIAWVRPCDGRSIHADPRHIDAILGTESGEDKP